MNKLNRVAAFALAVVLSLGVSACGGSGDSGSGSSTSDTAVVDVVDLKGNMLLSRVVDGKGSDIVSTLESNGYTWNEDRLWWISEDGNNLFYVMGEGDYEYSKSEVEGLSAGGAGTALHFDYVLNASDYGSLKNALNTLADVEVVDSFFPAEDVGVAVVRNSAGQDFLIMATQDEDYDAYRMLVFNPEASANGLTIEWLGAGEGTTAAEIWESITGEPLS